jgi:hypothetical protein
MSLTELDGAFAGCSETGLNISFLVFNSPIAVATRSKMWVCGRFDYWDCGFETRVYEYLSLVRVLCVLYGTSFRDGPIARPETTYLMWYV